MEVSPGQALRDAIEDDTIMVVGAPNALAAKLIEQMGIGGIYLSGAALSAGVLALPDVGLFSLTELAQQATYLTRVIDTPLIVDADTGFGDIMNVERTIVELEAAGVAAIQLEDQQLPKRCGHLSGKSLVEPEAMCAKLQAAAAARRDDSLVLLARTDARGVTNLDDAIDRAKRYIDAGADWIFPEALASAKEFERFAKAIDVPLVANMTEFGKSPLLTRDELADLGYAAVLYPVTLLRVAMKAMEAALALLATEGTQRGLLDLMQTRDELYELIEYEEFEQRDRQFFGGTGGSP
ncbi:MAG: methylisocitrate lyase [Planctomycetales bacterium]|nr:methylisocitrate lyase [Planctomycetales bacterium]MCA9202170.1 methylisocitrate lyase [Planctomycetales bacterium]